VEYRLTPKGEALSRVVREIETWVEDWDDATEASGGRRLPREPRAI
jgi:DNA-binding HxlR family transcriptional regulator